MTKPKTMPCSLPEYTFGRPLWVVIVVLNTWAECLEHSTRDELRGERVPKRLLDPDEARAATPQHLSDPVLATFAPKA